MATCFKTDDAAVDTYGGAGTAAVPIDCPREGAQLPLTGYDVWIIAVVAVALIALGFLMRKFSKTPA